MHSSERSTVASELNCLNAHWFLTLADAQEKMEDWRNYYNEERPRGGDRPKSADYVAESQ
jgi:transposase InsO family protein